MSVVDSGIGFLGPIEWSLPARVAKPCDSCAATAAVVHCRVHDAFLCADCDGRVHGGVGAGHERVWMCDVCEQAPAAVTCKADAAALCVSCDADIHSANPLARRHNRVPVEPFYQPALSAARRRASPGDFLGGNACESEGEEEPPPAAAASSVAPPSPKLKPVDFFFDPLLDVDYYSFPIDAGYGLIETAPAASTITTTTADSVVPVQSKIDASPLARPQQISFDIDYYSPKNHGYNFTITNTSQTISCPSLDVGMVPDSNSRNISFSNGSGSASYGGVDSTAGANTSVASAVGMDREARVLRYREKRKNRKFEKTIRYASRKAYAESRPRIKGRFAKRAESANEVDGIYSTAAALWSVKASVSFPLFRRD